MRIPLPHLARVGFGCRAKTSEKNPPVDLCFLEEDEFQESPLEAWAGEDEDEDVHVWEANESDDNIKYICFHQLELN
uniref:Uncharacterized protein n=1 Tax=Equus caballus TaxID=9796 RepID=A0A3Q2H5C4_HORSE